jgi:HPt (histidine-containing phosphotransfer) domain-containing protein
LKTALQSLADNRKKNSALDLLGYANRIGGVGRAAHAIEGVLSQLGKKRLRQALAAEAE